MTCRRLIVWVFALFLVGPIGSAAEAKKQPQPPRPNVLWISSDDHAAYTMGAYGSSHVKTPNLDRLANRGALFTRAYANSPVCTASRQSFITGRLPHAVGVTLLSTPLPEEELTLADYLKLAGYRTASIGKMHFNSGLKHGFDLRIDAPQHQAYLRSNPPAPLPEGVKTLGRWRPIADPARIWLNADVLPFPARDKDMDASFFVRSADQFLKQTGEDQPFFLMISFTQPHSPFHFPIEYAGRHHPTDIPIPMVYPDDPPQIPLIFRDLSDADKKGITAAYYTSVEYMDAKVGELLAALEGSVHATNTIVIYSSDHGYTLGHHGRFEKHGFWEPAVRSPLIISWPGKIRNGRKVDALTELVDLYPTICHALGLPVPGHRHGKSLVPVLFGEILDQQHRDYVVSQYHENEEAMVRTDRYKLIYCTGKRERLDGYKTDNPRPGRYIRLYDLKMDPEESRDLSNDPFHQERVFKMKHQLLSRLESTLPPVSRAPAHLGLEEKLDWYLVPPEVKPRG